MRSADKVKFNASSETGAWAHCNPTAPEGKAQELREAHEEFLKKISESFRQITAKTSLKLIIYNQ